MRFMGFVIGVIAAICVCGALTACKGTQKDAQRYLQEGKQLLEQGNAEQARVQFQNALQIQPKLAEAYFQLALIDEKKRDWKGMFGNLQQALGLNPKHFHVHLKLGQLYLRDSQLEKAEEEAPWFSKRRPMMLAS